MRSRRFFPPSLVLIGGLIASVGCGGAGGTASAPSRDDALGHVRTALDAWKAGKVEDLTNGAPPIRFVDPDQAAGARLDGYELGDAPSSVAHVIDVPAELTITDKKRRTRTVSTAFQVVASPDVSVLRNDP